MNPTHSHHKPHALIHPTAIIDPSAKIGEGAEIGPYVIIGSDVEIGAGTWIGAHAVVEHVTIGSQCKIHPGSYIGTPPQDLKYKGEKTRAEIGDRTVIRECVTVNRGTVATGLTRVGENCLLMAYTHVAHDCHIGKNVIMANAATLAGHVTIDDDAVLGGLVAIHQFTRVGTGAMLGGGAKVASDVAPFCMVQGDRAVTIGLNLIGLRRRGVTGDRLSALKKAYRTVFYDGLTLKEAVETLESGSMTPEVRPFVEFIKTPSRGLTRPARDSAAAEESTTADV